jgi:hypothetical protein
MNHAKTSFRTEICAGAIISVVQYLAPLRSVEFVQHGAALNSVAVLAHALPDVSHETSCSGAYVVHKHGVYTQAFEALPPPQNRALDSTAGCCQFRANLSQNAQLTPCATGNAKTLSLVWRGLLLWNGNTINRRRASQCLIAAPSPQQLVWGTQATSHTQVAPHCRCTLYTLHNHPAKAQNAASTPLDSCHSVTYASPGLPLP